MKKRVKRTHHFRSFVVLLMIAALTAYAVMAYRLPLPALAAESTLASPSAQSPVALAWPNYGESAIGAAGYGVLATHGNNTALPTASVAKVMTALAVLKVRPLAPGQQGPTLTLTQADVNSFGTYLDEDGSVVKVVKGEKITEYQALQAMLLPSANNLADSLAKWAFGSLGAYSSYANSLANTLGMNDSHFGTADASGFSPSTTASAHDLVLLGLAALKNPVIAQIVSEKSAKIPVAGKIYNVNGQLGLYGINGIKTGSSNQDPGAYLFSSEQELSNGQTINFVGVVMGATSLDRSMYDALPLLKSAPGNFKMTTVVHAGQVVGHIAIPWGGSVSVIATKSLHLLTWGGQQITPTVNFKPLNAPFAKGTPAGTITTSADPNISIPIVTQSAQTAPSWQWRVWRKI